MQKGLQTNVPEINNEDTQTIGTTALTLHSREDHNISIYSRTGKIRDIQSSMKDGGHTHIL